jgi:hypothetical protein
MKRLANAIALIFVSTPALVHACPMCFAGGEQNADAFVYGSLFLMIVPTVTLGGLGYWAYRRLKAIDDGVSFPVEEPQNATAAAEASTSSQPRSRGEAVVLQLPARQ